MYLAGICDNRTTLQGCIVTGTPDEVVKSRNAALRDEVIPLNVDGSMVKASKMDPTQMQLGGLGSSHQPRPIAPPVSSLSRQSSNSIHPLSSTTGHRNTAMRQAGRGTSGDFTDHFMKVVSGSSSTGNLDSNDTVGSEARPRYYSRSAASMKFAPPGLSPSNYPQAGPKNTPTGWNYPSSVVFSHISNTSTLPAVSAPRDTRTLASFSNTSGIIDDIKSATTTNTASETDPAPATQSHSGRQRFDYPPLRFIRRARSKSSEDLATAFKQHLERSHAKRSHHDES